MRVSAVALASTLLWGISPIKSFGQDDVATKLQEMTRGTFYSSLVNNALARIPPSLFQRCPALVSNGSNVTIRTPISFGVDGYPNGG
jgi:hypothetical protein